MARLPTRYHLVLWAVGLLACIGAGAWLATSTLDVVMWHYGALAGAVVAPVLLRAYTRFLATGPASAVRPPASASGPASGPPDRQG